MGDTRMDTGRIWPWRPTMQAQEQFHLAKPLCALCKSMSHIFTSKSSIKVSEGLHLLETRPQCNSRNMQSSFEFDSTPERSSIRFFAYLQAQLRHYYDKFQSAKVKMEHLQDKFGFQESHLQDFQKLVMQQPFNCETLSDTVDLDTPVSSRTSSNLHSGRCTSKCVTPRKRPRVSLTPFSKSMYKCPSKCCISKVLSKSGCKELKKILHSLETYSCDESGTCHKKHSPGTNSKSDLTVKIVETSVTRSNNSAEAKAVLQALLYVLVLLGILIMLNLLPSTGIFLSKHIQVIHSGHC